MLDIDGVGTILENRDVEALDIRTADNQQSARGQHAATCVNKRGGREEVLDDLECGNDVDGPAPEPHVLDGLLDDRQPLPPARLREGRRRFDGDDARKHAQLQDLFAKRAEPGANVE